MVTLTRALNEAFGVNEQNGKAFLAAGMVRIDGYVIRQSKIEAHRIRGRTLALHNVQDGAVLRGPVRPWGEPSCDG